MLSKYRQNIQDFRKKIGNQLLVTNRILISGLQEKNTMFVKQIS